MMHYLAPLHEVLSDTEAVAELDSLSSHLTSFLTSSILMLLFEICAPKVRKLQWEQSSASIECALAFLTKTSKPRPPNEASLPSNLGGVKMPHYEIWTDGSCIKESDRDSEGECGLGTP